MTTWAWYPEGGCLGGDGGGTHDDLWDAIEEGVAWMVWQELPLDQLRVGPMRYIADLIPGELLVEADLGYLASEGALGPDGILDLVVERYEHMRWEGSGGEEYLKREAFGAWDALPDRAPATVLDWARQHIVLDPDGICMGDFPFPIQYRGGKWSPYEDDHHKDLARAMIGYKTDEDPETGHTCWVWWADGDSGQSKTLRDAMHAAEKALSAKVWASLEMQHDGLPEVER